MNNKNSFVMEQVTHNTLPEAVGRLLDRLECLEQLISSNPQSKAVDADELLTIQQAGDLINLSVPTIYGLVSRAEIPHSKKGKRLYFSKQELTDWIKSGRKKTTSEIEAEATNYVNRKKR